MLPGLLPSSSDGGSGNDLRNKPDTRLAVPIITNSLGMKFIRIEPGDFIMGQGGAPPKSRADWSGRDWDESPAHRVKISRPFYLGACEVTNAQYERFDPVRAMEMQEARDDYMFASLHQDPAFVELTKLAPGHGMMMSGSKMN